MVLQLAAGHGQIEALTKEIGRLAALVAKGNEQITELMAIAMRNKRGERKSPAKPPESPPSLDDEARVAFVDRPAAPDLPQKKQPERVNGSKTVMMRNL